MLVHPHNMTAAQISDAIRTAEEPSRSLDDRIWLWVNRNKLNPCAPGWQYDLMDAPHYTSSVDAALTLLPKGGPDNQPFDFVLEHTNGGLTIACRVGTPDKDAMEFGCNNASAVTRAAIVAHMREGRV